MCGGEKDINSFVLMELIRSETFFRAFFVPYSWLELVPPAPEPTTTAETERNMEERRAEEILSGEIKNFSSTTQSLCCCATQRRLLSYQRSTSMLSKYILDIYQETVFLIHKYIYIKQSKHTLALYTEQKNEYAQHCLFSVDIYESVMEIETERLAGTR